jgi:hypothetical protein
MFISLYGSLDSFSAFPFENFLGLLKKRIKCNNAIFQQSIIHLTAMRSLYTPDSISKTSMLFFSSKTPNNCAVFESGDILYITHAANNSVSGYKMSFFLNLYSYPYASISLGIGYYKLCTSFVSAQVPVNKAICIPTSDVDIFLVIPYA